MPKKICLLIQFDCLLYDVFLEKINNDTVIEYFNNKISNKIDKLFLFICPDEKIIKYLEKINIKYLIINNKIFQKELLEKLLNFDYDYFIRIIGNNILVSNNIIYQAIEYINNDDSYWYYYFNDFPVGTVPSEIFSKKIISQILSEKKLYENFRSFSFIKEKTKSFIIKPNQKLSHLNIDFSINKKLELKKVTDILNIFKNNKIDIIDVLQEKNYKRLVEHSEIFKWNNKVQENSIILNKEILKKQIKLNSKPEEIALFVTEKCNIKCNFCDRNHNYAYKNIDFDIFKLLLKKLLPVKLLNLTCWGEPFFYPYFFDVIKLLSEKYPYQNWRVTTNGLIINKNIIELINKTSIQSINISVNAGNSETYKQITGTNNYYKLFENIKTIIKYRKGYNVFVSFVACQTNIQSLPEFIESMANIGVYSVRVMYMIICNENDKKNSLLFNKDLSNKYFDIAIETAVKNNIILHLPQKFYEKNSLKQPDYCYDFWRKIFIKPNGDVIPCCYYNKNIGNLFQTEFSELWNNKKYIDIRKKVLINELWRCNKCPVINSNSVDNMEYHLNIKMLDNQK